MEAKTDRYVTEFYASGEQYVLPRRDLGAARHAGWVLAGFGLFITLFMCAWMYMPIQEGVKLVADREWFGLGMIGFGLLGLFGLVPGLGMMAAGLALVSNSTYCVVSIRDGKVYSTERVFLFRWRRKCVVDRIGRLRVTDSSVEDAEEDRPPRFSDLGYAIAAERSGGKPFFIAPGYSHELLTKLAKELAPRMEAELVSATPYKSKPVSHDTAKAAAGIAVVDDTTRTVPTQPLASDATIERREDGVIIRLPPAGIWRGSKGLLFFAVMWNAFILLFIVMLVSSMFGGVEMEGNTNPWLMLLFLTPFIAVGVGLTLASINMGKRHAIIATASNSLFVSHHSLFGKQVREWASEQMSEIRVGPSGTTVNDRPVMELQIYPQGEKKFGLLSERSEEELEWVAGELNQSLQLAPSPHDVPVPRAERDKAGDVVIPHDSPIELSHSMRGLEIRVPPIGITRHLGSIFIGSLFAAIGIGVTIGVVSSHLDDGFEAGDLGGILFISLWTTMFTGAGLAVLITGLVTARRRFEIRTADEQLRIDRYGPFGHKQFVWGFGDIQDVLVADSGMKVNNRSLPQVQVVPRDDKVMGMMTDRDATELSAVAAAMRDAIGLAMDVGDEGDEEDDG